MAAQDAQLTAQVGALVVAQAQARVTLADKVAAFLQQLWATMGVQDFYDNAKVGNFTAQAAQLVQQGRVATSEVTDAYLGEVFGLINVKAPTGALTVTDQPRGIPMEDEFLRGVKDFRRFRAAGLDELVALQRGLDRDVNIATYDLTLAMRDTAHQRLTRANVRGYRRVVRPELSRTGVCGLCIAASHRIYRAGDLLPLHARCKCEVVPVGSEQDVGRVINDADLSMVYEAAGSTGAKALKRTKFAVHENGQLGPVLTAKGDAFRGPSDVQQAS